MHSLIDLFQFIGGAIEAILNVMFDSRAPQVQPKSKKAVIKKG